jgi:F420-0:gamma-glutamyl ligase-like protein
MVGFGLILAPFGVLADVLPLAGTIVRMGTGLIGFVLGLLVGTVTIAIAWFAFRPILTAVILLIGGAIAFAVWRFGRGRAKKKLAAKEASASAA